MPQEPDFSAEPLSLAHRHMARVTGIGAQVEAEPMMDAARSAGLLQEQAAHIFLARAFAELSQADSLATIAVALEKLAAQA